MPLASDHGGVPALFGGVALGLAMSAAPAAALTQQTPQAVTAPFRGGPIPPAGLKVRCPPGPDSLVMAPTCPVIQYRGYATWLYSFRDNRDAYGVVSYDAQGQVVRNVVLNGGRYISPITLNPSSRTFTLWGQANSQVALPWADLP